MKNTYLLHHLIESFAADCSQKVALTQGDKKVTYGELKELIQQFCNGLAQLETYPGERVGIFLPKEINFVVAAFGSSKAGQVFVPINPNLKPAQVKHILNDCGVKTLVTTSMRFYQLSQILDDCPSVENLVISDDKFIEVKKKNVSLVMWQQLIADQTLSKDCSIDNDLAAILYTSGSTGKPKGVMLSHLNMVAGAKSVSSYLQNNLDDKILAVLPFSFDAGFSQLTTAFHVGAEIVLFDYLMPKEVINIIKKESITGMTAVPPVWIQLAELDWPENSLRYIASTGGKMPIEISRNLNQKLPTTSLYIMYGLTEAFRSTFLDPKEYQARPESIGKAIPNNEVLILREDHTICAPDEQGELVHRGSLVSLGYWNDPEKTNRRFRPLKTKKPGQVLNEICVFSGDLAYKDKDGFIYFVGRSDEMIKTSGYRVSPLEVEEGIYESGLVAEACAFGIPDKTKGQRVVVVVAQKQSRIVSAQDVINICRGALPNYMIPSEVIVSESSLPRNNNGKIDRSKLLENYNQKNREVAIEQ